MQDCSRCIGIAIMCEDVFFCLLFSVTGRERRGGDADRPVRQEDLTDRKTKHAKSANNVLSCKDESTMCVQIACTVLGSKVTGTSPYCVIIIEVIRATRLNGARRHQVQHGSAGKSSSHTTSTTCKTHKQTHHNIFRHRSR